MRETLRSSLSLLAWQIREIGPGEGDLYAIAPNSITLRSIEGSAVVCSTQSASGSKRLGLQDASGYFQSTVDDSAMVWGTSDAQWHRFDVSQSWNTPSGAWSGAGLSVCFWGDSTTAYPRPQAALEVQGPAADLATANVGSVLRAYRRTEYGLYQGGGRWWLGRRVGASNTWERLAGPLRAPADSGLVFTYRDATGAITNNPTQVHTVDILLRGESESRPARPGSASGNHRPVRDSLSTTVYLRNS